jgi:Na+/melibiose symporter-like transporter
MLPRLVAAAVLLAVGMMVAMLLAAMTRRFVESAGIKGARFRGQIVGIVVVVFTVLLALEQLGLAAQFVFALVLVVLAGIALALGLAFGLGCRDLARDFVLEYLRSLEDEGPRRPD